MNMKDDSSILDQYFKDNVKPKLNYCELDVIKDYTYNYFGTITSYFNDELDDELIIGDIEKSIKVLKHAIKLCHIPVPLTVYHGTSSDILGSQGLVGYKKAPFKVNTFMSTSIDLNVASSFSKFGKKDGPIVLQMNLPKGYPALWLKPISGHDYEKELLLENGKELTPFDYEDLDNGITLVKCNIKVK